jgi:repressor LexA
LSSKKGIIYVGSRKDEHMSEQDFNKLFAKRLKYYLDKYDMTQKELAHKLGVGTTIVSDWVHARKTPRMDKIDAMCEIFHYKRVDLINV